VGEIGADAMTIDYALRLRKKEEHELIAFLVELGIWCGAITADQLGIAKELQRAAVRLLLQRKSLAPEDAAEIRRRWPEYAAEVSGAEPAPAPRKLSATDVEDIRRRLAAHEPDRAIARAYGVSSTFIRAIRRGRAYRQTGKDLAS
jgi:hypothetical protein